MLLTAVVLTATGIVSVFFMCMAYAANTDSKTNAYETACSVTVIAGVTIMVYFQAAMHLHHMAAYDLASIVMLTSATALILKRPSDVLPPPDRMTVMWWGLLAQCL